MARGYRSIAEYYDPEYEHLDYLKTDVPFLLSRMPKRRQRVLEMAVGTGRAAIPIAQAGHVVTGVDIDPGVLAIAERKRGFVGLTEGRLGLVRGDVRSFRPKVEPKRRGESAQRGSAGGEAGYDWCVLLFNTFLAFADPDDLSAVLETAHRCLRAGSARSAGRIWIDIFNPDLTLLAEGESYGLDPVTFHVPALDPPLGRTVSRTTDLQDVGTQVRQVSFHYTWFSDGEQKTAAVSFEMTWMYPRELYLLLESHGFEVEHLWGDHGGGEYHQHSPRIIVQARRR